jgi:toxin YoeB
MNLFSSPFSGIGKPEPLRREQRGYWSRRIDAANRIVYKIENGRVSRGLYCAD